VLKYLCSRDGQDRNVVQDNKDNPSQQKYDGPAAAHTLIYSKSGRGT